MAGNPESGRASSVVGQSFRVEERTQEVINLDKQRMDAMMKAGLLKEPTEDKSIHVEVYDLTAAGERAAGNFCYGHREITSIDNFTPPTKAANGMLQSQVAYHYKMMDVPVWAKTDDMLKAFPEMAKALAGDATGQNTLANAGVGWQVPN